MNAAIITIGDEILIGQVLDTNSQYMAKALDRIGIGVSEMLSVPDDRATILETFQRLQDKVALVLITGGLGPTKDDITKKTLCDYFEDTLVLDKGVLAHVETLFRNFTGSDAPLLQVNIDQALVPSKAEVLHNEFGTAPGMWLRNGKTVFISLPGVPFEMKGLMDSRVIPRLATEFERPYIVHKTVMTYGMGESALADKIAQWEDALPAFIKLAYLPSPGRVRLRLSARGTDKQSLEQGISEKVEQLRAIIGEVFVGLEDEGSIEAVLGSRLAQRGLSVATAESCTGGKISQLLTSIPGSSRYFKGGIVCYSKEVKTGVLGVSADTIREHTVVSAEVAAEMAQKVRGLLQTDFGIGVTGNAGPATDDTHEETGIVFIAVASGQNTTVERFNFGQPREKVIDRASVKSLEMLQKEILKNVE